MKRKIKNLSNIIFTFIEECVIFYCSFRFIFDRILPLQRDERLVYCKPAISVIITYFYKLAVCIKILIGF